MFGEMIQFDLRRFFEVGRINHETLKKKTIKLVEGSILIKGQGWVYPVHVRVLQWYLLCSTLGFLGIITHKYPLYRAYIGISHDGVRGDRGTSLPIP